MPESPQFVTSLDAIASISGISARSWREWNKRDGFPKKTDEGWPVLACLEWHKNNVNQRSDQPHHDEPARVGLNAKREQKLDEEIKKLRIDNAAKSREMIPRAEVEDFHLFVSSRVKSSVYQHFVTELPPKTAGLDAIEVRKFNREAADVMCKAMQNLLDDWAEEQRLAAEAAKDSA